MNKTAQPDMSPCDDCGKLTDHRLLDAVLLDKEGNTASGNAYCATCWPKHQRVADDKWRSLLAPEAEERK